MMNDTDRFEFLANVKELKFLDDDGKLKPVNGYAISVNTWLVQLIFGKKYYTAYFADPPGGPAKVKYDSVLDAMRAVIDKAASEHNAR